MLKLYQYQAMSSPPLRVFLNSLEEQTLWELRKAKNIPNRIMEGVDARATKSGYEVQRYRFHSE